MYVLFMPGGLCCLCVYVFCLRCCLYVCLWLVCPCVVLFRVPGVVLLGFVAGLCFVVVCLLCYLFRLVLWCVFVGLLVYYVCALWFRCVACLFVCLFCLLVGFVDL